MHITTIQLRFNDIDMMGHVNNAVIMEYLDLAKSYYFAAAGVPVTPDEGDFTVMIVRHEIDFKRQIHYHDCVEVQTQTVRVGNKSLHLLLRLMANDEVACECRTVMSGYLRSTGTSAAIPEELKTQILRYDATH